MKKIAFMIALLLYISSAFDFNPAILIKKALGSDTDTGKKTLSSDFTINKKAPGITAGFSRDDSLEVVRDDIYKLMWQDGDLPHKMAHGEAVHYCENLNFAGFNDWRLPTVNELLSITDDTKFKPSINKAFKNVAYETIGKSEKFYGDYWSSSKGWRSIEGAASSSSALLVYFSSGGPDWYNVSGRNFVNRNFVRCVRQY